MIQKLWETQSDWKSVNNIPRCPKKAEVKLSHSGSAWEYGIGQEEGLGSDSPLGTRGKRESQEAKRQLSQVCSSWRKWRRKGTSTYIKALGEGLALPIPTSQTPVRPKEITTLHTFLSGTTYTLNTLGSLDRTLWFSNKNVYLWHKLSLCTWSAFISQASAEQSYTDWAICGNIWTSTYTQMLTQPSLSTKRQ